MIEVHEVLKSQLEKYGVVPMISDASRADRIKRIAYPGDPQEEQSAEELIVIDSEEYLCSFQQSFGNYLVFFDDTTSPRQIVSNGSNIFAIPKDKEREATKTAAASLQALKKVEGGAYQLLNLASKPEGGLDGIMDAVAELLDNPVALVNLTTQTYQATSTPEVTDDELWSNVIKGSEVVPYAPYSDYVEAGHGIMAGAPSALFQITPSSKRLFAAASRNSPQANHLLITLESRHRFRESDMILAIILVDLLEGLLQRNQLNETTTKKRTIEDFFGDVVGGRLNNEQVLAEARDWRLNLGPESVMFLLFFRKDMTSGVDVMGWTRRLERKVRPVSLLLYEGYVIFVVGGDAGRAERELLRILEDERDAGVRIAVSLPFSQVHELKLAYQQCKEAQLLGRRSEERVLRYSDHLLEHLLANHPEQGRLREYVLPVARHIVTYDRDHRTDYAQTLRTYLEDFADRKRASAELCIHFNSIGYRLHKAEELFGIDLDDYASMRALLLSLQILEM